MGKCKFNKNDSNLDLQDVLQDTLEEIWEEKDEFSRKACRNARCTFFLVYHRYKSVYFLQAAIIRRFL